MKCFKKACIISTTEDSHGEKRSKEDLEDFLRALPPRLPIGIEHDLANVSSGYIENFAVVAIEEESGEWKLIGDLFIDDLPDQKNPLRGLSFSFTSITERNNEEAKGCIYLPFPYYNHDDLNQIILESDFPLAVGKWHKKTADPLTTGVIIGFVTITVEIVAGHLYDRLIRPFIDEALDRLSKPEFDNLSFDYVHQLELPDGSRVQLILLSGDRDWTASLQNKPVKSAFDAAFKFLTESDIALAKPVSQLRMVYQPDSDDYKPHLIHFSDGEHLTIG